MQRYEVTRTQQNRNSVAQGPRVSDKNTWMPPIPSQVRDRKEDSWESSQSSGPQEILQKTGDSASMRSSCS